YLQYIIARRQELLIKLDYETTLIRTQPPFLAQHYPARYVIQSYLCLTVSRQVVVDVYFISKRIIHYTYITTVFRYSGYRFPWQQGECIVCQEVPAPYTFPTVITITLEACLKRYKA